MAQIGVGLLLGAIGLTMLADRFADRDIAPVHSWWPWVLIVMGAARVASPTVDKTGRPRGVRSAAWLVMIGLWGLATEGRWLGLGYPTSWPLLVIAAGVLMVWHSLDSSRHRPRDPLPDRSVDRSDYGLGSASERGGPRPAGPGDPLERGR